MIKLPLYPFEFPDVVLMKFHNGWIRPFEEAACWLWRGETRKGYGVIRFMVKSVLYRVSAHRFAFALAGNTVDREDLVRHSCDNPACVNPAHMELGTQQDNQRDKVLRGRQAKGSKNGQSVLTEVEVRALLLDLLNGFSHRQVAKKYGVSLFVSRGVTAGQTWRHVFAELSDETKARLKAELRSHRGRRDL